MVVSGLPRSGTSMAMAMLAAGGLPCLSDGLRKADADNPKGYFEFERAKKLETDRDPEWLCEARGKAVKVVSPLLKSLPEGNTYRVLFMLRDLDEVLASQKKMMERRGERHEVPDDRMKKIYRDHLAKVDSFMKGRPDISVTYLDYRRVIAHARETAGEIAAFLGLELDIGRMAAAVDAGLYRNRRT
ncbi:MAG TPA: hypothetical protein VLT81_11485 [Chondromyces sp.]|nr:hypothetical protein [Chondromyces sp.]